MSDKQTEANRLNALKSTGAITPEGKAIVSKNRITHGILTNKLLAHENLDDYQTLLDSLLMELNPNGALESSLVEKIAIVLWRNRRLVRAENASIELGLTDNKMLRELDRFFGNSEYGGNFHFSSSKSLDEIKHLDLESFEWCKNVIAEQEADNDLSTLEGMKKDAPLCYGQLEKEAKDEEQTPEEYYEGIESIWSWLHELKKWCNDEISKASMMIQAQTLIPAIKEKLTSEWKQAETLTKYQTSLDNQLYKAMKALREQQEFRLKSIDGDAVVAA